MLTELIIDTGEISMNYAEGGTTGPPLVLLHGLTVHWASLQPLIPLMRKAVQPGVCNQKICAACAEPSLKKY